MMKFIAKQHQGQQSPEPVLVASVERLLEQRSSLASALSAVAAELPTGRYRRELNGLVAKLNDGASAEELCRLPNAESLLLPLLTAKEFSADVGLRMHERLAESRHEGEIRRERHRVFSYPFFVLSLSALVVVSLSVTVVPIFADIFEEFGLMLPALTEAVVALSNALIESPVKSFLIGLAVAAISFAGWRLLLDSEFTEKFFGYATAGNSREVLTMACFVRRLSEGLAAGFPLPVALRVAAKGIDRSSIRKAAVSLAEEVARTGGQLSDSPAARRFPATMIHLINEAIQRDAVDAQLAERTASDDAEPPPVAPKKALARAASMLDELAELLLERVASRFTWYSGAVAQLSLVFVGGAVATVVLAMLLPLVTLITALC